MVDTITGYEASALRAPPSAFLARAPYNDRFQYRLGSALTPQALTSIQRQADIGYLYQWVDALDELREADPHLHAELFRREAMVAGAAWDMEAPEDSGDAGAKIADYVKRVLCELDGRGDMALSFADLLHHLQQGVYYGRSVAEVIWSQDGRRPISAEFVHPRRLAYATDWRIHLWDATGSGTAINVPRTDAEQAFAQFPGVPLDLFPAGKFVVHRPRVRGGYPTREGLGRTVCWYSLFKRFSMRDFLAFAEWAGRGLRVGQYSSGTGPDAPVRAAPEDVAALQDALEAMSSTISVVIPDTTQLKVLDAPNVNAIHEHLVAVCNAEMSKAIVGSTLGSDVGVTGGNRALGEVHERVTLMIASRDAEVLSATLKRDLIAPMVERQFGRGAPVPTIRFATDPGQDLDALAKRLDVAARAGIAISQADARQLLQIPDPAEGAPLMVPR
jgi:phage gp29-like protein